MARPSHLFECLEHGPDGRCRLRLLTLEWSVQQARQSKREKEERHGRGDGHRRLRGGERKDLGWRVEKKEPKKTMKTRAKLRESDTGGGAKVKRIVMLLSVAALMVVMMAMSVAPAFATSTYTCQSQYGTHSGVSKEAVKNSTFYFNCVKERNNI